MLYYNRIEVYYNRLRFLKVLILVRQVHSSSVLFGTVGIFEIKGLSFNWISAMGVMMYYSWCVWTLTTLLF